MKESLQINASFDQPELLEDLVKQLARRRTDIGFRKLQMAAGTEALETSSTETYVNGTLVLDSVDEHINMPFTTCFLFTCIKGNNGIYKLSQSTSLS